MSNIIIRNVIKRKSRFLYYINKNGDIECEYYFDIDEWKTHLRPSFLKKYLKSQAVGK